MTVTGRMLFAVVAALAASLVSAGTSHAGLDNELSLVDGKDRTMTIQQWDTFLDGVFRLDRKRLTREWFHSGRAKYTIDGPGVADFAGTLELGYQVGFPWSLGVGINFSYSTPNILLDDTNINPLSAGFHLLGKVITRTCSRVCRSALTWATAPASRKSPPSRWTSPDRRVVWRCPTRTAR